MKKLLPLLAMLTACATGGDGVTAPAPAPVDARLSEMQASMTELLERIDVLNDRIARLETAGEATTVARAMPGGAPTRAAGSRGEPAADTAAAPQTIAATAQRAVTGAQLADSYRKALALYGANRAADARAAMLQVYNTDPTGDLADNALFWIGESYFAASDYGNAMTYYRRVTEEFGDQNKAPDAMFKLGVAQAKTGDLALARTTLQQVVTRYPYSASAASAKAELSRIKY